MPESFGKVQGGHRVVHGGTTAQNQTGNWST